jgi:hypothetical protein
MVNPIPWIYVLEFTNSREFGVRSTVAASKSVFVRHDPWVGIMRWEGFCTFRNQYIKRGKEVFSKNWTKKPV